MPKHAKSIETITLPVETLNFLVNWQPVMVRMCYRAPQLVPLGIRESVMLALDMLTTAKKAAAPDGSVQLTPDQWATFCQWPILSEKALMIGTMYSVNERALVTKLRQHIEAVNAQVAS